MKHKIYTAPNTIFSVYQMAQTFKWDYRHHRAMKANAEKKSREAAKKLDFATDSYWFGLACKYNDMMKDDLRNKEMAQNIIKEFYKKKQNKNSSGRFFMNRPNFLTTLRGDRIVV